MRVLVFHGYLLRGTGSNVYTASLVAAMARQGHDVHLLCQDREHGSIEWPGPGSVTVHVPDIGGLLPVYVRDRYEGFEVKTFPELTEAELDRYLEANVAAVRDVAAEMGTVDAALANHLVMGPVILARAGLRFAIKVHGSDLSYTVLPHLERFRPFAVEAAEAAAGILVGSGHIAERLREAVDDPAVNSRVRLGPPGVDTDLFAPIPAGEGRSRLHDLAGQLRGGPDIPPDSASLATAAHAPPARDQLPPAGHPTHPNPSPETHSWDRDVERAADAVERFAGAEGPRVVFVGKLIVSKGVDLLLAAWPMVHARNPGARLLIVGFGELEEPLRRLCASLEAGELDYPREFAARGRGLEGGEEAGLHMLQAFLSDPPPGYAEAARAAAGSVGFAGRLEHEEVGRLLPACDALVFPSTFPEAFGMVAAEAAAAGVMPVSAAHSGAAEVSRELAAALPSEAQGLVSFELGAGAVEAVAARLNGWAALDAGTREAARAALRETVARLWSWEGVASGVLAASEGRLDGLPAVPG